MTQTITRPVMRYHGAKFRLSKWIISHFPEHRTYVEPYAGAASVLLRKPRSYAEVYNDVWGDVVNVFSVLRDSEQAIELTRLLRLTPYARAEFELCAEPARRPVERARRMIFRSFAGFASAAANASHNTGFRANHTRTGSIPAHDWARYPDGVAAFTERLQGVIIENRPALDVITQYDTAQTLFYADPPYPEATRTTAKSNGAYAHSMTDDDHRNLAERLHAVRGMVVLSGYPCALYDEELYRDWPTVGRDARGDGTRKHVERLWLSPNIFKTAPETA